MLVFSVCAPAVFAEYGALSTSSKRVMWFCQYCGGHYEMAIGDRTRYYRRNKTACPKCKHHKRNTIFIF